jgi:hypothetical protein
VARGAQIVATRFIPTEPPVPASLTLSGQDSSCNNTIAANVKPDADQESSDAQKEASATKLCVKGIYRQRESSPGIAERESATDRIIGRIGWQ